MAGLPPGLIPPGAAGPPGATPPAGPGGPGGAPNGIQAIQAIMGQLLNESKTASPDHLGKVVENLKRAASVVIAHTDQSHPEVAKHMTRAYTALSAAYDAYQKSKSSMSAAGGPIRFSGAANAPMPQRPTL